MSVSKEEIMHIAKLADLNLTDKDVEKYSKSLNDILDYVKIINSVDTSKVNETIGANEKCNAFRKDEVIEFEHQEKLLQNAPSKDEGMFHIPNVIN